MRHIFLSFATLLVWATMAFAATYVVDPAGAGDYPTIQAAIDAAEEGDVIELTDGTFTGTGNREISFRGKAITVRSQNGIPEACIIDCQGSVNAKRRGFSFSSGEGSGSVLEGLTITGGYSQYGGAMLCISASGPTIDDCVFSGNAAEVYGGGIYCDHDCTPAITHCAFYANEAVIFGGGIFCDNTSVSTIAYCTFSANQSSYGGGVFARRCALTLTNCTLSGNSGQYGGGIYGSDQSNFTLENTLIAFGSTGEAVYCDGASSATLTSCDIFGNAGGDWVGAIADQAGIDDNISEDPLFCSQLPDEDLNWTLDRASLCVPPQSPGGLIGAWGVGCDGSPAVTRVSWGSMKALFSEDK